MQVPEHQQTTVPDTIDLSPDVHIDFHAGAGGVSWATLHTKHMATEIGTAKGPDDVGDVLTMAAAVLMERPAAARRAFADPSTGERWVLIGSWVLSARLGHEHTHHGDEASAQSHFNRLVGGRI